MNSKLKKKPKVSIVIPCYNQGQYIKEALDSVLNQTFKDIEIIVVNDGSTDIKTTEILAKINNPKIKVINSKNQGLAAARNLGISLAKGIYILPLDADDKIGKTYIESSSKILDKHLEIGIVYCLAEKFGAVSELWNLPKFSIRKMLFRNLIFCTALYRKESWEKVGGYKVTMNNGWEDWDFWLSILEQKYTVYRIPKILFFYLINNKSMTKTMDRQKRIIMHNQIIKNHTLLYKNPNLLLVKAYNKLTTSRLYFTVKNRLGYFKKNVIYK
jgi:glycosyltransferase involved in cell wall biosynthesis